MIKGSSWINRFFFSVPENVRFPLCAKSTSHSFNHKEWLSKQSLDQVNHNIPCSEEVALPIIRRADKIRINRILLHHKNPEWIYVWPGVSVIPLGIASMQARSSFKGRFKKKYNYLLAFLASSKGILELLPLTYLVNSYLLSFSHQGLHALSVVVPT